MNSRTKPSSLLRTSAVLLTSVSLASCTLSSPEFVASGGAFAPHLSGDVSLDDSAPTPVGDVSLDSDLDLGDREIVPYARAGFSVAGVNLRAHGFQTEQSSRGTLSAGFGDITVGSTVSSDLSLTVAQLSLSFDLVDVAGFRLAPGIAADYFDLKLEVVEDSTRLEETLDARAPIPLLYLEAEYLPPLLPVRFQAEIGGMAATFGDFDGTILDGQAMVVLELPGPFELFGGYRYIHATLDGKTSNKDFGSSLTLQGLMVGGSVRF